MGSLTRTVLQPPVSMRTVQHTAVRQAPLIGDSENSYHKPHFLGLPLEIRENIYDYVIDSLQADRTVSWTTNTITEYDSLPLVCRQLYHETWRRVFNYTVTGQQFGKLLSLPLTKHTFTRVRMLTVEIDHNMDYIRMTGLCEALNALQLSIQELHLLFTGTDLRGVRTSVHGCGNILKWSDQPHQDLLLLGGQRLDEKKFEMFRQLSLLRQLRVLRVRNANIPLNQGIILVNKPYLKALSVTSDPRSLAHNYVTVNRRYLKGLMTVMHGVPDIKALELTANAVMPASGIVNKLARQLEHFSWIVPNFDYQIQAESQLPHDFYEETASLIHILSWQAPVLSTLRLCIDMRGRPCPANAICLRDHNIMAADLQQYLPRFAMLEHLEIHYSGGTGFFRDELIKHLPKRLRRLYITDSTIAPDQLVEQVWQRYLKPQSVKEDHDSYDALVPFHGQDLVEGAGQEPIRMLPLPEAGGSVSISCNRDGRACYFENSDAVPMHDDKTTGFVCQRSLAQDDGFLEGPNQFCGEKRGRTDTIPSDWQGNLGCITYEYSCRDTHFDDGGWHTPATNEGWESDTTKIIKLSGKLLNKERHTHLRYKPSIEVSEGIEPFQMLDLKHGERLRHEENVPETARYSRYPGIYAGIYDMEELAAKPFLVDKRKAALEECLGDHWYFGTETEAMKVFEMEPVAKIDDQRPKSMLDVANSPHSHRCQWMSPDYAIGPVGSYPVPAIPDDRRSQAYRR